MTGQEATYNEREVLPFDRIEPPSAQALNRSKNRYDEIKTYFINRWLGPSYIPTNDEYADERKQKMTIVEYYKEMLDNHGKSACAVMVKQFYLDKVEWSTWTYRHIPADRRLNASKNLRQLAKVGGISAYRCTHYWLENEIIKKFYRSVKRPSVDRVKYHNTL